ncbi:MAG: putative TetR family transcriptional regulator, partial [Ilumatobacteraceae bacterium]|nr:putative TetR family transcriptional regulator [Ilumatobacteraceae bacterium]
PRDEACGPTILEATLDVVAEVGFAGFTVDAVAQRAGVGKATIYRRWASKEALMLEAWSSCVAPMPDPDTGTLRGDLALMFNAVNHGRPDDVMRRIFPQMIAASKVDPEVAEAYRSFVDDRRRPLQQVLARAAERGELTSESDLGLVHDLLVAPLIYRWMVSDGDVGPHVVQAIIDVVLTGVGAQHVVPTA